MNSPITPLSAFVNVLLWIPTVSSTNSFLGGGGCNEAGVGLNVVSLGNQRSI